MKSTPFQIIVVSIFGVLIVITILVLYMSKSGGSSQNAVDISLWGTVPSNYVSAVLGATNAEKLGLKVIIIGKELRNFKNLLSNKKFEGTIIK